MYMFKKFINIFKYYEWIFVIASLITLITLGIVYKSGALELISVILGLLSATLNGKRKKYAFFFYTVYVILYGAVSFIEKQYGEGVLNLCINLPIYLFTLYKFYIRDRKKENTGEFNITSIKKIEIILIIIFVPLVCGLYGYILSLFNSKLPYLNALATAFAVVACYLASKTSLYQWIFWNLYSVVLTVIWAINFTSNGSNGLLYLALNIIYFIINIYCLIIWINIKKEKNNYLIQ